MKKICISKDWTLTVNAYAKQGELPRIPSTKVDLPNDFCMSLPRSRAADGIGYNAFFPGGVGSYTKYMTLPEDTEHCILDIDGAYMQTDVRFNEELLAQHHHGYTPFLTDLTDYVRHGKINRLDIQTVAPQPSTRWYSGGGLYRDVYLWFGGRVRIEPWDAFITTVQADDSYAEVSAAFQIASDADTEARLRLTVTDPHGKVVSTSDAALRVKSGKKTPLDLRFCLKMPALWDDEHPNLYQMHAEVYDGEELTDTYECSFGIRTLTVSAKTGLLINGRSVKLRGGCIHHTHAALGAADYPAAIERQLRQLKAAGFNALRSAHNPPSLHMLELCDRLGIYLMDEAFDMWREQKTALDYHLWFELCWAEDIASMVLRDRNHPSVISYSIGNEIVERCGRSHGAAWSARLCAEIKAYDTTRPVTSGVCGLWANIDEQAPDEYKDFYFRGLGFDGKRPETDDAIRALFHQQTAEFMAPLDIVGYNYLHHIYEHDHEVFPERVMWGSETWAITFYDSWMETLKHPHVIGDFCWTCYDNLGENGTGRFLWARDGFIPGISLSGHDWISCFQGDFDLAGFRRPQSFFREAIFKGPEAAPAKIFTTHPEHTGEGFSGTGWHFYDVHETWTFDDTYIGKPTKAEVYTLADRVVWTLNGRPVGECVPEKAIASITVPYEPGTLRATLYRGDTVVAEASVSTHKDACDFTLTAEKDTIAADNNDLCYLCIDIIDEDGALVPEGGFALNACVSGGELMGIFSGDPKRTEPFTEPRCHSFEGHATVIVRAAEQGSVCVTVHALGKEHTVTVRAV